MMIHRRKRNRVDKEARTYARHPFNLDDCLKTRSAGRRIPRKLLHILSLRRGNSLWGQPATRMFSHNTALNSNVRLGKVRKVYVYNFIQVECFPFVKKKVDRYDRAFQIYFLLLFSFFLYFFIPFYSYIFKRLDFSKDTKYKNGYFYLFVSFETTIT